MMPSSVSADSRAAAGIPRGGFAQSSGPPQYGHHHSHGFNGMMGGVPPFPVVGVPHHQNVAATWLTFNDPPQLPPQPRPGMFRVSSTGGPGRLDGSHIAATDGHRSTGQPTVPRQLSGGRGAGGGRGAAPRGGGSSVSHRSGNSHAQPSTPTDNLFICYLPPSIDDHRLQLLVEQHGLVRSAKVMVDLATKQSRGFGFALMASCNDAIRARDALDGCLLENKRLQVRFADPPANDRPTHGANESLASASGETDDVANQNTNLYVKGIPLAWTDENLSQFFAQYGPVASAVVLMEARESKGIGLVRYQHPDAVAAVLKAAPLRVDGWLQPITVRFSRQTSSSNGGTQAEGGHFSKKQTSARHRHVPDNRMSAQRLSPEHQSTASSSIGYAVPPLMHSDDASFMRQQPLSSDGAGDWAPVGRQDTDAYEETVVEDDMQHGPPLHGGSSSATVATSTPVGQYGTALDTGAPPVLSATSSSAMPPANDGTKVIPGPFGLLLKMHNPYYNAQRSGSNPSSPDGCASPKIPTDEGSKRYRGSAAGGGGVGGLTPPTALASRPPTHNFAPLPQSRRASSGHHTPSGYFYSDPTGFAGHTCQYCQCGTTIRVLNVPNDTSQFEQWVDAHLSGFGPVAGKEVYYNGTALITFVDAGAAHMAVEMLSHSGFEPELYDCSQGEYVG